MDFQNEISQAVLGTDGYAMLKIIPYHIYIGFKFAVKITQLTE